MMHSLESLQENHVMTPCLFIYFFISSLIRVLPHKGDGTIDYIDYYGPEFQYQASFKLGQKSVVSVNH